MSTRGDYGERIKLGTHTAKARVHALVVFSILVLALLGRMLDSQAGWITCPPRWCWRLAKAGAGWGGGLTADAGRSTGSLWLMPGIFHWCAACCCGGCGG